MNVTVRQMDNAFLLSVAFADIINQHFLKSVTDKHGVILDTNDLFCQLSEYRRDELIGRPHNIIKSGVHSAEFFRNFWATIQRGEVWHGEVCNRARSGRLYWVDTFVMPCQLSSGEAGYLSIRYDITQLKELQSAVEGHSAAIDKKNERLNQIAFAIAHEVRAPLSNILGIVEAVEAGSVSPENLPRMLSSLKRQALAADQLFRKIMASAVDNRE